MSTGNLKSDSIHLFRFKVYTKFLIFFFLFFVFDKNKNSKYKKIMFALLYTNQAKRDRRVSNHR